MATDVKDRPRFAPLGELPDYRVAEGNPDIRGWEVYGADSLRLGEVRELLVDTGVKKARYLVAALDRTLPNVDGDRCVVVPIGRARLDDALDRVYLDGVTVASASTLPTYTRDTFDEQQERALFGGGDNDDFQRPEFDADRFFGARKQGSPDDAYVVVHEERYVVRKADVNDVVPDQPAGTPPNWKKEPV